MTASRTSGSPQIVTYTMGGRAKYGKHYTLSGTFGQTVIPAGSTSTTVTLTSYSFRRGSKAAIMFLNRSNGYVITNSTASVTITASGGGRHRHRNREGITPGQEPDTPAPDRTTPRQPLNSE